MSVEYICQCGNDQMQADKAGGMQTLKRMCECTQQGRGAGGGRHITCVELVAKIHAHD
jgi:hypothetical protein